MTRTVTVRRLQRETPAVLREIETTASSVIVTRDGVQVARIVPISTAERLWRAGHCRTPSPSCKGLPST